MLWKVTQAHLRHAYQELGQPSEENIKKHQKLILTYHEYLNHNDLELALDTLEELGDLVKCKGGFWRNLERAATTMQLSDRASALHDKFIETLRETL